MARALIGDEAATGSARTWPCRADGPWDLWETADGDRASKAKWVSLPRLQRCCWTEAVLRLWRGGFLSSRLLIAQLPWWALAKVAIAKVPAASRCWNTETNAAYARCERQHG